MEDIGYTPEKIKYKSGQYVNGPDYPTVEDLYHDLCTKWYNKFTSIDELIKFYGKEKDDIDFLISQLYDLGMVSIDDGAIRPKITKRTQ